jgi:hypothetical protein
MVREGVMQETQTGIDSEDIRARDEAHRHRNNMERWFKSQEPLSYAEDAYIPLLRCLNRPNTPLALPLGNVQSMSTFELAAMLFDMAKPDRPSQLQAPVCTKGSFLNVLKVAVKLIMHRASEQVDLPKYVVKIIASVLDLHKIHHVVWSAPLTPGENGRPTRKAVYNYWRSTGKAMEHGQAAIMQVLETDEREELEVRNITTQANLTDVTSDWKVTGVKITDFAKYLHKQRLPEECDASFASLTATNDYVGQTYTWVTSHYTSTKPVHKLALVVAYLFTKVLPHAAHGPAPAGLKTLSRNSAAVTAAVRAEPWIVNTSTRKGCKDPTPFLVMVFVYIVALMEPDSPLRRYMRESSNDSLGEPWTKKHGKHLPSCPSFTPPCP